MGRGAREIGPAIASGRENDHARAAKRCSRPSARSIATTPRHSPSSMIRVDREVLDIELGIVPERLLIECMQHRVPGAVGCSTGALRRPLAVTRRHAAERALVDPAVFGPREWHAVVLELDDRRGRLLAHVGDGILIAEPVRSLYGVVHVPAPVVLAHVAERSADPALGSDRMTARRKYLRETGRRQALFGESERRPEAGPAGADDHDIVAVVDEFVVAGHHGVPSATLRIANTPAMEPRVCANVESTRTETLSPVE